MVRVTLTNPVGELSKVYTIKGVAPKITTKSLADATISTDYTADLEATGTPAITWSATGLPEGLNISTNGQISGTPTAYGKFTVRVTAQNSAKTATKSLKLNVLAAPSFGARSRSRPKTLRAAMRRRSA